MSGPVGSSEGGQLSQTRASDPAISIIADPTHYPRQLSVADIFAAVAKCHPSRIAVKEAGGSLTYADLESRSLSLARGMIAHGVGAGDRVALAAPRGAHAIAAMLAAMRIGAIVAPLDPCAPLAVRAAQLESLAPRLILNGEDDSLRLLHVESAQHESRHADWPFVAPTAPALVMFTSGSTGRPKGVVVPHRAIVRLVRDQEYAQFDHDTVFLHASPLAFDASTLEIWGPLLNGGVVAAVENARPSLDDLTAAMANCAVNSAWFTAGLFHLLVESRLAALAGLRLLIAGGDVLSAAHVNRALAALPATRLVNGYGPTENTTFTACSALTDIGDDDSVPIGRPLRHGGVHILDDDMRPVSVGEVGRLWAFGDGLALGYLGLREETAARFRDDPFSDEPGARMYDTGDLASWRRDGQLRFHGRADRQVKINGLRVELDGIEAIVRAAPFVKDAAVIARPASSGAPGDKRIEAYVVLAKDSPAAGVEAVRIHLRANLAQGSVPSLIISLDALPLTPQGKVDRAQLAPPHNAADRPAGLGQGDGLAARIASIWASVLGQAHPSIDTNFFDLGGTSMQMIRVHMALMEAFGPVPLVALFEHPTIATQAKLLAGQAATGFGQDHGMRANAARSALERAKARANAQRLMRKDDA
jgi:amino acid adenylation domain-containing protein